MEEVEEEATRQTNERQNIKEEEREETRVKKGKHTTRKRWTGTKSKVTTEDQEEGKQEAEAYR